ncbi:MAG: RsmB/NOP family class I SAM-dependent RNA methyltransferase [Candidatus Nanoarchaeia archaeon]
MNLLQRYKNWGEEFDPQDITIPQAIRITTKADEKKILSQLEKKGIVLKKIPYLDKGYEVISSESLSSTAQHLAGYFYIQEAASQLPVQVASTLCLPKNPLILDMCAAPGSKTTQLADVFSHATIVALDNQAPRLQKLIYNLERVGASNVVVYKKDAKFSDDLGQEFDVVLLDAPCSGNFCVQKDFFMKRTLLDVQSRLKEQSQLLNSAYLVTKKGGYILYSTCSLEIEENEEQIHKFLQTHKDLTLETIDLDVGDKGYTKTMGKQFADSLSKTKRFWPHKTNTQGFFIALIKKN